MLQEASQAIALAVAARAGTQPAAQACETVADLERRADEAEIRLRRLVLVHASTHGAVDLPACLVHMSIAKDAERISDLALGLCRIGQRVPPPPEPIRGELTALGDDVVSLVDRVAATVPEGDAAVADELIKAAHATRAACYARLDDVLLTEAGDAVPDDRSADDSPSRVDTAPVPSGNDNVTQPAALALSYRHLARIAANVANIAASMVVPVDHLDHPDAPE
jgi:phosphate uptake regulator